VLHALSNSVDNHGRILMKDATDAIIKPESPRSCGVIELTIDKEVSEVTCPANRNRAETRGKFIQMRAPIFFRKPPLGTAKKLGIPQSQHRP
jgi:hypothetical protein